MLTETRNRLGLALLIASSHAAAAVLMAGCSSSDDTSSAGTKDAAADAAIYAEAGGDATTGPDSAGPDSTAPLPQPDAGDSATGNPIDAAPDGASDVTRDGAPDSASDSAAPVDDAGNGIDVFVPPPPPAPWIILVNASPNFGPMALCLSTPFATPNIPPEVILPQNAGTAMPYVAPPPYNEVDLTSLALTYYAIPAANVVAADGGTLGCFDLIMGDAGAVAIGTFAAGALSHGASYLAPIGGSASNLAMQLLQVDEGAPDAGGGIGAQFVQASAQWEAAGLLLDGGYAGTMAVANAPDGAAQVVGIATFAGPAVPATAVVLPPFTAADGGATFTVTALAGDGDPTALTAAYTLPEIQAASLGLGASPAAGFLTAGNWTFVLVGDPAEAAATDAGAPNPLAARVLAFPNQP